MPMSAIDSAGPGTTEDIFSALCPSPPPPHQYATRSRLLPSRHLCSLSPARLSVSADTSDVVPARSGFSKLMRIRCWLLASSEIHVAVCSNTKMSDSLPVQLNCKSIEGVLAVYSGSFVVV